MNGHAEVLKDALHRHLRDHADPSAKDVLAERSTKTFAVLVSGLLGNWPSLSADLCHRLNSEGMHEEADIVATSNWMPDTMRTALQAADGSDASELLEARALARCVREVLRSSNPEVARQIAALFVRERLHELAGAFTQLADDAERCHVVRVASDSDARHHVPAVATVTVPANCATAVCVHR